MRLPLAARSFPHLVALAACLTLACGAHAQDKKAQEAAKKAQEAAKKAQEEAAKKAAQAAKEAAKLSEAEALGQALVLLLEANQFVYGGHCGKAKDHVIDAIKILDGNVLKKGTPAQKAMAKDEERALAAAKKGAALTPAIHENQEASNAQLREAAKVLAVVHGALAQNKQQKAGEQVKRAVEEIEGALAFQAKEAAKEQKKFVEAEVLREVFVMLADANHDYDGHRAKAVGQVKDALKILDASIMKRGSPAEKAITAAEERMAKAAVAARDKGPQDVEAQKASDDQLRKARELLHKVHGALAESKQHKPAEHVHHAIEELDIALKVR
jgi:hypothetical protein